MADRLPDGSWDCHVHVIGPQARYPMVADRHYTPREASVEQLLAHRARCGTSRAVIVQPSVYGTDNTCLIDTLAALGGASRGIAVVDEDVTDDELAKLHAAGVRGLRVNLESGDVQDPQLIARALTQWGDRIAHLGWHVQVYASLAAMAAAVPHLGDVSVPIVMDHFAMVRPGTAPDDARFQAVLSLLAQGNAYVKLSAPYRIGSEPLDAGQAANELAHAFIQANPDRVVWASDWPHTGRDPGRPPLEESAYRPIESAWLLRDIHNWLPTAALRQQVLVDNPTRLYGA